MKSKSSMELIQEGDTLTRLKTERGTIILLGTAHVSEDSVQEVESAIKNENPDVVCIELDQARYHSLHEEHRWKNLDIYQIIKEKKTFFLLSSLVLSAYQKRLGLNLGTRPGDEMRVAISAAEERGIPTALVDRDISITLNRAWRKNSFWGKNKLLAMLVSSAFSREKLDKEAVENLKKRSALDDMMEEMAKFLPTTKEVLINERDDYLSIRIWQEMVSLHEQQESEGTTVILAVVGAGHVPGIIKKMQDLNEKEQNADLPTQLKEISQIPPRSLMSKAFPWLVVCAVIALLTAGFITGGLEGGLQGLLRWVLINGSLSAIGAALALAHPVTIISSFLAAPITSMNPTIGVGFVTGLLESLLRKPRVQDFENLGDDIASTKGFFHNRITHILLVFLFSSIGSAIGTFVALPLIFP